MAEELLQEQRRKRIAAELAEAARLHVQVEAAVPAVIRSLENVAAGLDMLEGREAADETRAMKDEATNARIDLGTALRMLARARGSLDRAYGVASDRLALIEKARSKAEDAGKEGEEDSGT